MANPFLREYGTTHATVPFNEITLEHFEEAIIEGIRRDKVQVEKIATNPDTPTFANTIGVVSEDNTLERAATALFNLCSAETNDELEEIAQRVIPLLTDHSNALATDERMFQRVKYVKDHEYDSLTVEQRTLTDKIYEGFIRHGVGLPEEKRERFKEIDREVSGLTMKYAHNVLKATNEYQLHLTDEADLDGLPQTAVELASQTAREAGLDGWLFTLKQPSISPFLTYSSKRELRKQMYLAKNTICRKGEWNNTDIVRRIVNLRREFAQLLGYTNFADFVLKRRMAADKETVYEFLNKMLKAYLPAARKEIDEIAEYARKLEGNDFLMQPWDFAYYSHLLKKERYDLDSEMLRPYFELEKVKRGVFGLAGKLYGITFVKNAGIQVYHPEVEAFDVIDADGTYLAVLYIDYHPRKGKKGGAWMTNYKEQFITPDNEDSRPHVSVVMNVTRATGQFPALLTLGEVTTFLHEFGHALHGIFSRVRYQALSGTNVSWDFVELPSQIMENWATEPEWLATFARHYETGEPLPKELLDRIVESRNYLAAYSCVRQLSFCFLDMAYYTLTEPFTGSVKFFEDMAWRAAQVLPWPQECCMSVQFEHIMSGGYSAGYYSYKWAEVLDADAFSMFRENGIFNSETARRFREEILSKGSSEDSMTLYHRFRGSAPRIEALMERDGILRQTTR
ncbi:MAG: M3 family metallopeptidase [Bacteroidaceae bacterium]|nr:M3 family metallopeptidase [Bacteroidaceae bacterium]